MSGWHQGAVHHAHHHRIGIVQRGGDCRRHPGEGLVDLLRRIQAVGPLQHPLRFERRYVHAPASCLVDRSGSINR
jgi:hypothetical protein